MLLHIRAQERSMRTAEHTPEVMHTRGAHTEIASVDGLLPDRLNRSF